MTRYLRVESTEPDAAGRRTGIFGLLRDLRGSGRLSSDDAERARVLVARAYELHAEPPADAYLDGGLSWFVADASDLYSLCGDVVELVERYGVPTRTVGSVDPGRVTYIDDVQVVAVPPLTPGP